MSLAPRRRAVLQGGFAAAAVLVQLSAAGGSQALQELKPDGVDVVDSPFVQGEWGRSVLGVAVMGPTWQQLRHLLCLPAAELLKRSQEKKEQRDKERLAAYYKKNFKVTDSQQAGSACTSGC